MSDPTKQDIGWGKVLRINAKLVFGALILFYGWLSWQGVSAKWWGLWLLAMLCFFGGAIQVIGGVVEAIQLILRLRRWKDFQNMGSRPRADHMVQDRDFDASPFQNGGRKS